MYAEIVDGVVTRYPFTITDLRRENPNTSFPPFPSDETLAAWNVYPVQVEQEPMVAGMKAERAVPEQRGGVWVQSWVLRAATPDESAAQAQGVRAERNDRLSACDWTQLSDAPVNSLAWANYRQALRDVPSQSGFPWDVSWPAPPT